LAEAGQEGIFVADIVFTVCMIVGVVAVCGISLTLILIAAGKIEV
jgi:hypothetical protein